MALAALEALTNGERRVRNIGNDIEEGTYLVKSIESGSGVDGARDGENRGRKR